MQHRGILVMSCLYRTWAKLRLFQQKGWLSRQSNGHLFSGIEGMSAEDAWFASAVAVEGAQARGDPAMMVSMDMWKAFDQVNRPL
eukprot:13732142-Alexandrium_andersonii.AAC.1